MFYIPKHVVFIKFFIFLFLLSYILYQYLPQFRLTQTQRVVMVVVGVRSHAGHEVVRIVVVFANVHHFDKSIVFTILIL